MLPPLRSLCVATKPPQLISISILTVVIAGQPRCKLNSWRDKMKPTVTLDRHAGGKRRKKFLTDECGAVTVDWVVLTAAVVGLAALAYAQIEGGSTSLSGTVRDMIIDV
jgi:hypothetical protein